MASLTDKLTSKINVVSLSLSDQLVSVRINAFNTRIVEKGEESINCGLMANCKDEVIVCLANLSCLVVPQEERPLEPWKNCCPNLCGEIDMFSARVELQWLCECAFKTSNYREHQ